MAPRAGQHSSPHFRSWLRSRRRPLALLLVVSLGGAAAAARMAAAGARGLDASIGVAQASPAARWFKGNLHTHTLNSDGDSTPDEVVRWYREHGYDFLVLTDHNFLTGVDGLNAVQGAPGKFLVVKGEEVSGVVDRKPVHVNGFDVDRLVDPPQAGTVVAMLQGMVDAIRGARGVPSINHPNFVWAITADELAAVQRTRLFEVYNGHPTVHNLGGGGVPGLEEVWDRVLSSGRMLYGIAVDDAHHFKRPWDPTASTPGHGWVFVRAAALEPRALVEALDRGEFYSSTGVELAAVEATAAGVKVAVKVAGISKYRIQFIGRGGRVLREVAGDAATYEFTGDEGYVRAKVLESNGAVAWTQPVPVGAGAPR
ncbi:MAG: PHP domain-containing protein [Acidobacteria bacterium]|nr:PHP domain-containing protein [Acidobacteriota bacterium]